MRLNEIGEFGFIERFRPLFNNLIPPGYTGIGDDCAIIPAEDNNSWLMTTDMLIENVHFLKNAIHPKQLGYKSLTVNLSDIAAMGGFPTASFLSVAIPKNTTVDYLDEFMTGYLELSEQYNVPLLGGDTTASLKDIVVNVCVLGKCSNGMIKKRNAARVGDLICVTGYLGESAAGLQAILDGLPANDDLNYLIYRHHTPTARLKEGQILSSFKGTHAMMDISDGISSDLLHITESSHVGARINVEKIPLSPVLERAAICNHWNEYDLALSGGEDYELLCTVAPDDFENMNHALSQQTGCQLYNIGTITSEKPGIRWFNKGNEIKIMKLGFNHFQ